MTDQDECHCGEPAVAQCPCCKLRVCLEHFKLAAERLAEAVGIPGDQDNALD